MGFKIGEISDGGFQRFMVIMWWLFLVDMVVVGGFWRLLCVFFFLCGGSFLWLWLWLVVGLVV